MEDQLPIHTAITIYHFYCKLFGILIIIFGAGGALRSFSSLGVGLLELRVEMCHGPCDCVFSSIFSAKLRIHCYCQPSG